MSKSQDVRVLLMETADRLFFEKGYDAVGVADICKVAGKAKGLFFYYFEKKANVVKVLVEGQVKAMMQRMKQALDTMPLTATEKMSFFMQNLVTKDSIGPRAMSYFKKEGIPDWFDYYTHQIKDRYVLPIIMDVVRQIADENETTTISDKETEIIYLGISFYMHNHFSMMADETFYQDTMSAMSHTIEKALSLPKGTIRIQK
ncbi:MAG: TetR/AcrR family transcriptional regulator [Eubacteriales bacterium]